jgi:type I restriction enzyme M protein
MKYVSDKYTGRAGAVIEVPVGGGFGDMVKLKGDKEIGDKINKIIGRLAEANDLKGVIDQADFNDEGKLGTGKEMQDRPRSSWRSSITSISAPIGPMETIFWVTPTST